VEGTLAQMFMWEHRSWFGRIYINMRGTWDQQCGGVNLAMAALLFFLPAVGFAHLLLPVHPASKIVNYFSSLLGGLLLGPCFLPGMTGLYNC